MVKTILADITIAWIIGKEVSIPAINIAKDRLSAHSDEDLPVNDFYLSNFEDVDLVLDYGETADKIMKSVIAGFYDPKAMFG